MPIHELTTNLDALKVSDARSQEYREQFSAEVGDLEDNGYEISDTYNLFPWLENIVTSSSAYFPEYKQSKQDIQTIIMLDISPLDPKSKDPALHNRRAVLLETKTGERAIVAVSRHGLGEWGNFGGAGLYHHNGSSRLAEVIDHTEKLASIMTQKSYAIGTEVRLRGSKTVIDSTDWSSNPTLQFVTGMLFSPKGPFPKVITGSDAGQTPETIERMAHGSRTAGGIGGEIVGTQEGLPDTAGYCRYTMLATYESLREQLPEENLPPIDKAPAAIQGLGKIGMAAAEIMIDQGSPVIYIADVVDVTEKVAALRQRAEGRRENQQVIVVSPEEIYDQPAAIFCPCSTAEGIITSDKIDRLHLSDTRAILSGANGPIPSIEVAAYAEQKGIVFPHETISNGGSATAAAMEALEYLPNQDRWQGNHGAFVQEVLVPHIFKTVHNRLLETIRISATQDTTLYEGSIIATQVWLEAHA